MAFMVPHEKRYQELANALAERNLKIRQDSKLCSSYIETGLGQVSEIVDTMELMEFLYKNTKYKKWVSHFESLANDLILESREYESRDSILNKAKYAALKEYFENFKSTNIPTNIPISVKNWFRPRFEIKYRHVKEQYNLFSRIAAALD